MKETKCEFCGAVIQKGGEHVFFEKVMCKSCYNELTEICCECGERVWRSDMMAADESYYCRFCYNERFTSCNECGAEIRFSEAYYFDDNEEYPYCRECYERLENRAIHDYDFKPEPIFYGDGAMYMGVELEIDGEGEYNDNAETILNVANKNCEHIYCKHDGSLDEGFEIVSHPMTLSYHEKDMPWKDIFEKAVSLGYRSHQTSTCGLHIHVNRSFFGETYNEQENVIARVVYFVEAHWNELLRFSRRTEGSIMRWASRYGIEENTQLTYSKAKKGNMGRYVCVNLQNDSTIEFRIFRGTLRYETFIATLQLIYEICIRAKALTDNEFESLSWGDFVLSLDKSKTELIEYLKQKLLYVNEPIDTKEEL